MIEKGKIIELEDNNEYYIIDKIDLKVIYILVNLNQQMEKIYVLLSLKIIVFIQFQMKTLLKNYI